MTIEHSKPINKEIASYIIIYMTYDEKKSLYESIMKDVSKILKSKLNEKLSDINTDRLKVSKIFGIRERFENSIFNKEFVSQFPEVFKLNEETGEIGITFRFYSGGSSMKNGTKTDIIYAPNMLSLLKKIFVYSNYKIYTVNNENATRLLQNVWSCVVTPEEEREWNTKQQEFADKVAYINNVDEILSLVANFEL